MNIGFGVREYVLFEKYLIIFFMTYQLWQEINVIMFQLIRLTQF